MSVGTYISGTGHVALILWMVTGWGMSSEPLPFEVADVSIVSGAEFAALSQGARPDLPASAPAAIEQPQIDDSLPVPDAPNPLDVAPAPAATPSPIVPPLSEIQPAAPDLTVPETVVTDTAPPTPDTPTIVAPPPSAELGVSPRPIPRPAPRVAPQTISPPAPDATVAPDVAQAASDQVVAPVDEVVDLAEETTAPEAATDQIVTEAEVPAFAPEISSRPQTRPNRPAPAPVVEAEEAPAPPSAEAIDPVAAALAAAGATQTPAPAPAPAQGLSGGQLSEGDKSGFLRQIGTCWNTGTLSTGAQNTVIEMAFEMTPDGRPVSNSVQLDGFSGGSAADADAAFQAARRALLRCAGDAGYDLPREQFEQWQRVVLTVDPTAMRQR